MSSPDHPPVLDINAAAAHLGITPNTLGVYRFKRYPPGHRHAFPEPFMRVGNGRTPLWTSDQLDAWQAMRADTLKHGKRYGSIATVNPGERSTT